MRTATDVFVSDLLGARHPAFHAELTEKLARFGVTLREIPGTRDIWCRDYMPILIAGERFVQFRYCPEYLADEPKKTTPPEVAAALVGSCTSSELVIDGGNVVRRGGTAIVTDKIFAENRSVSRVKLVEQLRAILEVEHVIVIPTEPGDMFGHADGVLHLLDERTALVNDYSEVDSEYGARLGRVLRKHGIAGCPTPYTPDLSDDGDVPAATGVYVNLLETPEAIFVPVYSVPSDEDAVRMFAGVFGGRTVVPIDCQAIAYEGGSLHCITWHAIL